MFKTPFFIKNWDDHLGIFLYWPKVQYIKFEK